MEYKVFGNDICLRVDPGEAVVKTIIEVCEKLNISCADFSGIGGCESAVVKVFDPKIKDFGETEYNGMLEMISLNGNLTNDGGKPYVHAHAIFAYIDENGNYVYAGGHLGETVVKLTAEIVIRPIPGNIGRQYKEELGIKTWKL